MAAPSISDSVRRTAAVGIALATAWAGGSCVSDHDALARRPEIKGGGSGGGRDAAEESVSSAGGGASGTGPGVLEAGDRSDPGPLGPNELTLLHGVSDSSLGLPSAAWLYALLLGAASGIATLKRSGRPQSDAAAPE